MLEALLRASPAGLSAEKLLEQAWDENADPFTNIVTCHDQQAAPQARRAPGHPNDAWHRLPDRRHRAAIGPPQRAPLVLTTLLAPPC